MQPYSPLQTLLAAAALRERVISVVLFDATFHAPEDGLADALYTYPPAPSGDSVRRRL
jgi:hypothetical protein